MEEAKRLEAEAMMAVGGSGQYPGQPMMPPTQTQQPPQQQQQPPQQQQQQHAMQPMQGGMQMQGQGQGQQQSMMMMPPQPAQQVQGMQQQGMDGQVMGTFDMPMFNTGFTPMGNMFETDVSAPCSYKWRADE
jgi:hypothetical protein